MADGTGGTLAERSNGTGWAIQQTPNPPGPVVSVLLGVSCAAAATCVAVGGDLVERWNGNTWTIESIPTQEPPLLSRPRFARRRFRAAGGPKTAAPDAPVGTRIRFNLSIPAKLMITVTQTGAERLHTGACMAPTVKLARMHAKRCSRTVTIGTLTNRPLPAGRVSVRFSGRIARRALRPGEYDAVLIARGPGTFSNPVTLPFVIAR